MKRLFTEKAESLQINFGKDFEKGGFFVADLRVKLCGIEFANPVMPAAGPPVRNADCILAAAKGGAGGIVTKTISVKGAEVPRPCMEDIGDGNGLLNTELWSEMSPEVWIESEYKRCRAAGLPVIISIGYKAEEIKALAERVTPFADALEISTHYVGKDIHHIVNSLKAAKSTGLPVFMKISPGIPDVAGYAEILESEGADGFVAINSVGPCMHINIETGLPFMGSPKGYGWLSGKAIKPIALRHVFEIASAVKVPVIGVGGISNGLDAIEMMMAGASAVQMCTAPILHGPGIYGRVVNEMNGWLNKHGYSKVSDITGLTIKKMQNREWHTTPQYPEVLEEACISCGRCSESCAYQAITLEPKAVINTDKCFGCGLCVTRCNKKALKIE